MKLIFMMYDNFYDNWVKRSTAVISLWDNIANGYTPLLKNIVDNSIQELNKLLYFSSNFLLKNVDKNNTKKISEIKSTKSELTVIRQEVQEWKNEFEHYPFKFCVTKVHTQNNACFICNKKLISGYGFCISLKFYYKELDLWSERYRTKPVGPTCLNTLIKKYELSIEDN